MKKHLMIFAIIGLLLFCFSIVTCVKKVIPLNIVFISGSNEYVSHVTLAKYKQYLEENFKDIKIEFLQASGEINSKDEYSELPGLEALDNADIALIFTRRLTIEGDQLEKIKTFVKSGKPIVALRTASHGFQNWLELDSLVLGGNYHGHYPGGPEPRKVGDDGMKYPFGEPTGPIQKVAIVEGSESHPVLTGVDNFESKYSLYKTSPVADDVTVLLEGNIPNEDPEPLAWTRIYNGARVVYIALGGLQDWENPIFKKLVTNAIFWAAGRDITK